MPRKKKEEDKKETVFFDTSQITKDLMTYVDSELDKRIDKAVDHSVRQNIIEEIEKSHKKVIRMKNRTIFVKNIFLVLFFLIIVFLVYLLYSNHYLDSYFSHADTRYEEKTAVSEPVLDEKNVEVSLEDLKEKYASLIVPYVLSEKSCYLEDFYQGKITDEMKNYYSLIQMDFSKIKVEDDYNTIDASEIQDICLSMFDGDCRMTHFEYNGNKVRYFEKLGSYITNELLVREASAIRREIVDISEEKDTVRITTIEGIVSDGKVYSVYPYELVGDEPKEGILSYTNSLNKMVYIFRDKKLVSVEKG